MSEIPLFIGIDTSNYTTSMAVTDREGHVLSDRRSMLPVKKGDRGLRQSEALFHHVQALPGICRDVFQDIESYDRSCIKGIAYSSRPRPVDGSYMPVFTAGSSLAESLAQALKVPAWAFSHQEGHLRAAALDTPLEGKNRLLFFHLSGGTTEAVLTEGGETPSMEVVGGTKDISFGQLIDRVGVAMGMGFPAGKSMDTLACEGPSDQVDMPLIKVEGGYVNLSGLESHCMRILKEHSPESMAASLFQKITLALEEMARSIGREYGVRDVLFAGGVASSRYIRNNMQREPGWTMGDPRLCSDNAVGISLLGGDRYGSETGNGDTTE